MRWMKGQPNTPVVSGDMITEYLSDEWGLLYNKKVIDYVFSNAYVHWRAVFY